MEKKLSTYSFVSDDRRVYEPVCYKMLVGKVYYADGSTAYLKREGQIFYD